MTAASGADRPTLRDQLAKWIHDRTRKRSGDAWGWYSNELTETASELLSLIEPHVERAKAEAAAEALEQVANDPELAHIVEVLVSGHRLPHRVVAAADLYASAAALRSNAGGDRS